MTAGTTALTTGASSGIGLVTAVALAKAGLRSIGTVRTEAKGEVLTEAARQAGVSVEIELLDVTDAAGCERVIENVKPDVLVNNAGYGANGAVEDVGDDEARGVLETMLLAPVRLARLSIPHMRARRHGRIVNVSSIYGRTTTPLTGWYQAAKHGLEGVSDALRMEVKSSGIDVVLVEPGVFKTGIWEEAERIIKDRQGTRYENAYRASLTAMQQNTFLMGNPEDVASVIVEAVTSAAPSPRYLVGLDAKLWALTDPLTPTPVKDWLARWMMGL